MKRSKLGDTFEAARGANWRESLDALGRPTHSPGRCDYGCQYCFGPLDANPGVGQYECPWCIARFPPEAKLSSDGEAAISDAGLNYRAWALDLCALLDATEQAIGKGDQKRARTLVRGRFALAEKHGLTVQRLPGTASGETH